MGRGDDSDKRYSSHEDLVGVGPELGGLSWQGRRRQARRWAALALDTALLWWGAGSCFARLSRVLARTTAPWPPHRPGHRTNLPSLARVRAGSYIEVPSRYQQRAEPQSHVDTNWFPSLDSVDQFTGALLGPAYARAEGWTLRGLAEDAEFLHARTISHPAALGLVTRLRISWLYTRQKTVDIRRTGGWGGGASERCLGRAPVKPTGKARFTSHAGGRAGPSGSLLPSLEALDGGILVCLEASLGLAMVGGGGLPVVLAGMSAAVFCVWTCIL